MGTQLRNTDGSLTYRTELDYDTHALYGFIPFFLIDVTAYHNNHLHKNISRPQSCGRECFYRVGSADPNQAELVICIERHVYNTATLARGHFKRA
jgi:hypothetical protein